MKRIRIGILYQNIAHWMGGTYYIQNLISALCHLADNDKPEIVIFCKSDEEYEQIKVLGYPYFTKRNLTFQFVKLNIVKRILNKLNNKLTGYDIYPQQCSLETEDLNSFFPSPIGLQLRSDQKCIYWIPDFQEKYYPNYFSSEEILARTQSHKFIAKSKNTVIFSSENALLDFKKFFQGYTCKTEVMRFAVTHSTLGSKEMTILKDKYGIKLNYYISPNQFWAHKNHDIVIEAAKTLKERGKLNFEIVFTGKEEDYRNPHYAEGLKKKVAENGLEQIIKFLGFIDRNDQLQLIKYSTAVIQPSFFEGWSTVIEDAKALDKFIFASDLPVHREQVQTNIEFFDPLKPDSLAVLLASPTPKVKNTKPYLNDIKRFANGFATIVTP